MTIKSSGALAMADIALEAGLPNSNVNLNNTEIRSLAVKVTVGSTIKYSDLYGKEKFSFTNGDFSIGPMTTDGTTYDLPGWTIYRSQIKLSGLGTISGWPTPTDATSPLTWGGSGGGNINGDNYPPSASFTYTATLESTNLPTGIAAPSQVVHMVSTGSTTGYGIIHGPYLVTKSGVHLKPGDQVKFWWKAAGGSDAYDVFAYLLNITTGATIELLNATGTGTTATPWAQVSATIAIDGSYKFVFVSGTFDYSGGGALGASLYVSYVEIIKV